MFASTRASNGLLRTLLTTPVPTLCRTTLWTQRSTYATVVDKVTAAAKKKERDAFVQTSSSLFKTYKPITPGTRHLRRPLTPDLYEGRPVRALTVAKRKNGGRNRTGRITCRHRGGGHKQRIRLLDFRREQAGVHDVVRVEYDPGRSSHIALLKNRDPAAEGKAKWSYILATDGMRAGDTVQSFRSGIPDGLVPGFDLKALNKKKPEGASEEEAAAYESSQSLALGVFRSMTLKSGNVLPLRLIPPGTIIHNITLSPQGPAILVRSAGTSGQVMAHEDSGRYTQVRLQSGEVRKVLQDCCATIGKVSNPLWKHRSLGKAGRRRWLGWRPEVRGVAMNKSDHPHGGGRGKSKSNKHPVSIWGWGTKGTRTRKPGPKGPKNSNKMVIRERPRGVEKRGAV
ncbi:ribosomal protein L2 [Armillaria solidipes]|uniref:Large ribosomal subunit protein uL2m n=2 Tax=Armillaria TaxID=47424 RepID=A0A2H3CHZ7_9AGAR|nr:translation protein SH3-like domain-containing protein [Armillaria borealis]PBK76387.1 ribosomal protein L2 [Armillaria solidipes]